MGTQPLIPQIEKFRAMYRRALGLEGAIASTGDFGVSDESETPKSPVLALEQGVSPRVEVAQDNQAEHNDGAGRTDEGRGRASWAAHSLTATSPPTLPRVVVRGSSIKERAEQIATAAEECGRVHSDRARQVYALLTCGALALLAQQGATGRPNRFAYFMVADELPELLGLSRATVYRALDELAAGGLVARRGWKTNGSRLNPKTGERTRGVVTAGLVIDVVLTPERGTAAKVTRHELRGRTFRDLDADRSTKRTAWNWKLEQAARRAELATLEQRAATMRANPSEMDAGAFCRLEEQIEAVRQSVLSIQGEQAITHLLRWALYIPPHLSPVTLTVSRPLEAVYALADLKNASQQERGAMVDERARAFLAIYGDDERSLGMWRRLLWNSIFAEERDAGALDALTAFLARLVADLREWEGMRSAGSVLMARLRKSGWWDHLETVRFERRASFTKITG